MKTSGVIIFLTWMISWNRAEHFSPHDLGIEDETPIPQQQPFSQEAETGKSLFKFKKTSDDPLILSAEFSDQNHDSEMQPSHQEEIPLPEETEAIDDFHDHTDIVRTRRSPCSGPEQRLRLQQKREKISEKIALLGRKLAAKQLIEPIHETEESKDNDDDDEFEEEASNPYSYQLLSSAEKPPHYFRYRRKSLLDGHHHMTPRSASSRETYINRNRDSLARYLQQFHHHHPIAELSEPPPPGNNPKWHYSYGLPTTPPRPPPVAIRDSELQWPHPIVTQPMPTPAKPPPVAISESEPQWPHSIVTQPIFTISPPPPPFTVPYEVSLDNDSKRQYKIEPTQYHPELNIDITKHLVNYNPPSNDKSPQEQNYLVDQKMESAAQKIVPAMASTPILLKETAPSANQADSVHFHQEGVSPPGQEQSAHPHQTVHGLPSTTGLAYHQQNTTDVNTQSIFNTQYQPLRSEQEPINTGLHPTVQSLLQQISQMNRQEVPVLQSPSGQINVTEMQTNHTPHQPLAPLAAEGQQPFQYANAFSHLQQLSEKEPELIGNSHLHNNTQPGGHVHMHVHNTLANDHQQELPNFHQHLAAIHNDSRPNILKEALYTGGSPSHENQKELLHLQGPSNLQKQPIPTYENIADPSYLKNVHRLPGNTINPSKPLETEEKAQDRSPVQTLPDQIVHQYNKGKTHSNIGSEEFHQGVQDKASVLGQSQNLNQPTTNPGDISPEHTPLPSHMGLHRQPVTDELYHHQNVQNLQQEDKTTDLNLLQNANQPITNPGNMGLNKHLQGEHSRLQHTPGTPIIDQSATGELFHHQNQQHLQLQEKTTDLNQHQNANQPITNPGDMGLNKHLQGEHSRLQHTPGTPIIDQSATGELIHHHNQQHLQLQEKTTDLNQHQNANQPTTTGELEPTKLIQSPKHNPQVSLSHQEVTDDPFHHHNEAQSPSSETNRHPQLKNSQNHSSQLQNLQESAISTGADNLNKPQSQPEETIDSLHDNSQLQNIKNKELNENYHLELQNKQTGSSHDQNHHQLEDSVGKPQLVHTPLPTPSMENPQIQQNENKALNEDLLTNQHSESSRLQNHEQPEVNPAEEGNTAPLSLPAHHSLVPSFGDNAQILHSGNIAQAEEKLTNQQNHQATANPGEINLNKPVGLPADVPLQFDRPQFQTKAANGDYHLEILSNPTEPSQPTASTTEKIAGHHKPVPNETDPSVNNPILVAPAEVLPTSKIQSSQNNPKNDGDNLQQINHSNLQQAENILASTAEGMHLEKNEEEAPNGSAPDYLEEMKNAQKIPQTEVMAQPLEGTKKTPASIPETNSTPSASQFNNHSKSQHPGYLPYPTIAAALGNGTVQLPYNPIQGNTRSQNQGNSNERNSSLQSVTNQTHETNSNNMESRPPIQSPHHLLALKKTFIDDQPINMSSQEYGFFMEPFSKSRLEYHPQKTNQTGSSASTLEENPVYPIQYIKKTINTKEPYEVIADSTTTTTPRSQQVISTTTDIPDYQIMKLLENSSDSLLKKIEKQVEAMNEFVKNATMQQQERLQSLVSKVSKLSTASSKTTSTTPSPMVTTTLATSTTLKTTDNDGFNPLPPTVIIQHNDQKHEINIPAGETKPQLFIIDHNQPQSVTTQVNLPSHPANKMFDKAVADFYNDELARSAPDTESDPEDSSDVSDTDNYEDENEEEIPAPWQYYPLARPKLVPKIQTNKKQLNRQRLIVNPLYKPKKTPTISHKKRVTKISLSDLQPVQMDNNQNTSSIDENMVEASQTTSKSKLLRYQKAKRPLYDINLAKDHFDKNLKKVRESFMRNKFKNVAPSPPQEQELETPKPSIQIRHADQNDKQWEESQAAKESIVPLLTSVDTVQTEGPPKNRTLEVQPTLEAQTHQLENSKTSHLPKIELPGVQPCSCSQKGNTVSHAPPILDTESISSSTEDLGQSKHSASCACSSKCSGHTLKAQQKPEQTKYDIMNKAILWLKHYAATK